MAKPPPAKGRPGPPHIDMAVPPHGDSVAHLDVPAGPHVDSGGQHIDVNGPASFHQDITLPHADTTVPPHGDVQPHIDTPAGPHVDAVWPTIGNK